MDNNTVERTIRPITLNRKTALFAGHEAGAANRATFASLVETCKLNAVEPRACLTATLTAIVNGHKQSQIDDLMPRNFAARVGLAQRLRFAVNDTIFVTCERSARAYLRMQVHSVTEWSDHCAQWRFTGLRCNDSLFRMSGDLAHIDRTGSCHGVIRPPLFLDLTQ